MWANIVQYLWDLFNLYSLNVMSIITFLFEPRSIFGQRFHVLELVFGSGFVLFVSAKLLLSVFK